MRIKSVRLRNYRNYEHAYAELNPGMNLITGDNAQGKTNFIEALVYLSLTRSHRINDDKKLIREGTEAANIACIFEDKTEKEIEAVIYNKGKTLMIHHQPVKKASSFIGLLNTVLFSPDDLSLFHDAPSKRRKIMNQEIAKVSSRYLHALSTYQGLLKERNQLLKQDHINPTLLDTLDEQMSREENVITGERSDFTKEINNYLNFYYRLLSLDEEAYLSLQYLCSYTDCRSEMIQKVHSSLREKDILYHTTTCGIHREDLLFIINHENINEYASQGQKRMVMLSFKMSLLHYIERKTEKKPVLLLDDVLSELDETRQKKLLEIVEGPYQCIITATNVPSYMKERDVSLFHVKNGVIRRIGGTADE